MSSASSTLTLTLSVLSVTLPSRTSDSTSIRSVSLLTPEGSIVLNMLLGACAQCVRLFATPGTVVTRLLPPWDFPGKNTGVGYHFFLQNMVLSRSLQYLHVSFFLLTTLSTKTYLSLTMILEGCLLCILLRIYKKKKKPEQVTCVL